MFLRSALGSICNPAPTIGAAFGGNDDREIVAHIGRQPGIHMKLATKSPLTQPRIIFAINWLLIGTRGRPWRYVGLPTA